MKARIYAFDEVDRPEGVAVALTDLRQETVNEVNALREELAGCERKRPPSKKDAKRKGLAMKQVLLGLAIVSIIGTLFLTVASAAYVQSDISYDIASNPEQLYQYLRDTIGTSTVFRITPSAEPTTGLLEGQIYYDSTAGALFVYDSTTDWVEIADASGVSLDGAYNAGSSIAVDTSAVTLTVADGSNNVALAIVHEDSTYDLDAFTIANSANASTAVSIQIDGTAGYDIQGTGDTWNVTIAGVANLVGLVTTTGDVTFTGTLYNIIHDASADQLEFQDGAKLVFGTSDDMSFAFNAAGSDLDILFDDLEIAFGVDGGGGDVFFYSETASTWLKWSEANDQLEFELSDLHLSSDTQIEIENDAGTVDWTIDNATDETLLFYPSQNTDDQSINLGNADYTTDLRLFGATASTVVYDASADIVIFDAYDVRMGDGDIINFGDSADFSITATNTACTLGTLTTDETSAWNFGANTLGADLKLFGATTGSYMLWDATGDELFFDKASICLSDGDAILFGDTLGTGDFSLSATADVLTYSQVVASTGEIVYGASGVDIPIKWNGETAADWVYFNVDEVEFEDVVLQIMDDTEIQLGDNDDVVLRYDETTDNNFEIVAASVGMSIVTNDFVITTDGAAANQIALDATGETNGYATVISTTNGAIYIDADDTTNGDIDLNAQNDITLTTTGDIVVTAGGVMRVVDDDIVSFGTGDDVTMAYDEDGDDNLQVQGPVDFETTFCQFDTIPTFSNLGANGTFVWGGAATGTAGDENVMMFPTASFVYNILGDNSAEFGPQMRAGGFDFSFEDAADEGVEIVGAEHLVGGGKDNFLIGTDAFYLKVTIKLTDADGSDDLFIGFREVGAFTGVINDYNSYAVIGVQVADFFTETEGDAGTDSVLVSTDLSTTDWGDGETHELGIFIAANKAVTYTVDGTAAGGAVAFSWEDAETVVPFLFFLHHTEVSELSYLVRWECGLQ